MPGTLSALTIVGPGRVGTAIGYQAARNGYSVILAGRDREFASRAATTIGHGARALAIDEAVAGSPLVLLTVSDDAIESVCRRLATRGVWRPGTVVVHCSGALSGEALAAARAVGCVVGSAHPLQTFATVSSAIEHLPGSYWFYEGDEPARPVLEALGHAIGVRPVLIRSDGKPLYHAAAVFGCNYLVSLLDTAFEIATRAGIDRDTARDALKPLIEATLSNVFELDTRDALTGPIARGDLRTVHRHSEALARADADLVRLYRCLGRRTVDLAAAGGLDGEQVRRLRDALRDES